MKFEAHMTTEGKLQYLRENIPVADLFGQLAEECTELAQAALKMQRHLREVNPPPESAWMKSWPTLPKSGTMS